MQSASGSPRLRVNYDDGKVVFEKQKKGKINVSQRAEKGSQTGGGEESGMRRGTDGELVGTEDKRSNKREAKGRELEVIYWGPPPPLVLIPFCA